MKNLIVFLCTAIAVVITYNGVAQESISITSKEQAVVILKNHYFMDILRNPTDTIRNINLFIDEINKIVPVDQQKRNQLNALILPIVRQEGNGKYWSMLFWPWHGESLHIGVNVNDVVKNNFKSSDYEKINSQLSSNLNATNSAYLYLAKLRNKELTGSETPLIAPTSKEAIEALYEYFGI